MPFVLGTKLDGVGCGANVEHGRESKRVVAHRSWAKVARCRDATYLNAVISFTRIKAPSSFEELG